MDKQYLTKSAIESMGIELLESYVESGGTIVTNKEGAEHLKAMEKIEAFKKMVAEQNELLKKIPKKKHNSKYASNLTPSPRRHRKAKTKY